MYWALFALAGLGALLAFALIPEAVFWTALAAWVGMALQDAYLLTKLATPVVSRELSAIITVGLEHRVLLRVRSAAIKPGAIKLDVFDLHPGDWPVFGLPRQLELSGNKTIELPYQITPTQRGEYAFTGCQLRLHSSLRFWTQTRTAPCAQRVRVYPILRR